MRVLFINSLLMSVMALLAFWCLGLSEYFHWGPDNVLVWIVASLCIGAVAAIFGGSILRAAAGLFFAVNLLLGCLLLLFALLGGIPLGIASIEVDSILTGGAAATFLAMAAVQRSVWKNASHDNPATNVQAKTSRMVV